MINNFILSCDNITLNYGQNKIFANLTHDFTCGEIVLLCGNNGSGKSSLLKIIAGLITLDDEDKQDKDHIYLKTPDKNQEYQSQKLHTKSIFYMGHKQPLKENLTIFDHLYFHTKDVKLIDKALSYFHISSHKNTKIKNLSAGQKTKIILAKLYILQDKKNIWLLDEPFNTIDQTSSNLLIKLIDQARSNNTLIMIASHHVPKMLEISTIINMDNYLPKALGENL